VDSADRGPVIEAAVQEAHRLGAPLTIMHAFELPIVFGMQAWNGGFQDAVDASSAALQALTEDVQRDNPGLDVRCEQLVGPAAYELIKASRAARLIVVGCRGIGGFEELMLGSVSSQVAAHAHCPVIVCGRPTRVRTPPARWPSAWTARRRATRRCGFAFTEAASRDATLIAIHTWSSAPLISGGGMMVPVDSADEETAAQAVLDQALSAVEVDFPLVAVERRLVELVGFAAGGLIYGPFTAICTGLFQRSTPPQALSRVLAARSALTIPSTALGTLLGGPLVSAVGGRLTLLVSALLTIALGASVAGVLWLRYRTAMGARPSSASPAAPAIACSPPASTSVRAH